jgi:hypothetical protein
MRHPSYTPPGWSPFCTAAPPAAAAQRSAGNSLCRKDATDQSVFGPLTASIEREPCGEEVLLDGEGGHLPPPAPHRGEAAEERLIKCSFPPIGSPWLEECRVGVVVVEYRLTPEGRSPLTIYNAYDSMQVWEWSRRLESRSDIIPTTAALAPCRGQYSWAGTFGSPREYPNGSNSYNDGS